MAAKKTAPAKPVKSAKTAKTAPKASAKQAASPKKRAAAPRSSRTAKTAGDEEVTIDRRRKARRNDETGESPKPAPQLERRQKVQRRRQIDPTTCERDYSDAEVEFMNAMDQYKRTSGRMFPTCSEVLEVIRGLGYIQLSPAELTVLGRDEEPSQVENLDACGEEDFETAELAD